jgi:hypothetical protein
VFHVIKRENTGGSKTENSAGSIACNIAPNRVRKQHSTWVQELWYKAGIGVKLIANPCTTGKNKGTRGEIFFGNKKLFTVSGNH